MNWWLRSCSVSILLANSAFAANPTNAELWSESYHLEATGQYQAAAKALGPILEKFPRHEFAHLRIGWLNYLQGNHNASVDEYKAAMNMNPKSLDARLGVILPLLAQQRWREAALYSRQVLEFDPWNYYAHIRLMICEDAESQWEALEKHASEAAMRYPADATMQVYLARAYARLNKDTQARVIYEQVLERIPRHLEAVQYLQKSGR